VGGFAALPRKFTLLRCQIEVKQPDMWWVPFVSDATLSGCCLPVARCFSALWRCAWQRWPLSLMLVFSSRACFLLARVCVVVAGCRRRTRASSSWSCRRIPLRPRCVPSFSLPLAPRLLVVLPLVVLPLGSPQVLVRLRLRQMMRRWRSCKASGCRERAAEVLARVKLAI
jgi:hypothetical protein